MFKVKIIGLEKTINKYKKRIDTVRKQTSKSVNKLTEDVASLSKDYVPVDSGKLKASFKQTLDDNSSDKITTSISYDTPYAMYVHEDMTVRHGTNLPMSYKPKVRSNPQGKPLERAQYLFQAFWGVLSKGGARTMIKDIKIAWKKGVTN